MGFPVGFFTGDDRGCPRSVQPLSADGRHIYGAVVSPVDQILRRHHDQGTDLSVSVGGQASSRVEFLLIVRSVHIEAPFIFDGCRVGTETVRIERVHLGCFFVGFHDGGFTRFGCLCFRPDKLQGIESVSEQVDFR